MNAGRGILHSEMPEQQHGLMHGFQLWVNLPASRKLSAPAYRELEADQIPELRTASGSLIRGLPGSWTVWMGRFKRRIPSRSIGMRLPAGACEYLALPPAIMRRCVCLRGRGAVGSKPVQRRRARWQCSARPKAATG